MILDINNYVQLNKFSSVIKTLMGEKKFLFRTSASFLSSISNIKKKYINKNIYLQLRKKDEWNSHLKGLFVIGSYVDITTRQLNSLLKIRSFKGIKVDVNNFYELLNSNDYKNQISILKKLIVNNIRSCLRDSKIPVLFTSRKLINFDDQSEQIRFFQEL